MILRAIVTQCNTTTAERSKAWVCGRSVAGIAGSNSAEGTDVVFVVCCVGSDLCDELITRPEESHRLCVRVCVCVRERLTVSEAA